MLTLLLLGCTPKPEGVDSAHQDTGPCSAVAPLDPRSAVDLRAVGVAMFMLRDVQESWRFGLVDADEACPAQASLPDEGELTVSEWTGGCETAAGVRFEGALRSRSGDGVVSWTGEGWSASGGVAELQLDGSWDRERSEDGEVRLTEERLTGTLLVRTDRPVDPRNDALPMGFTGDWALHRRADALGDTHAAEASLTLPCRGELEVTVETLHSAGEANCGDENPDEARIEVTQVGQWSASLTTSGEAACAECWTHEVDGEVLGEACL